MIVTKRFSAAGTGRFGTIQRFTAPVTGTYTITVVGACGSQGSLIGPNAPWPIASSAQLIPGKGASVKARFEIPKDTVLNIVVGQKGVTKDVYYETYYGLMGDYLVGGGGGGHSAVFMNTSSGEFLKNGQRFTCLTMAAGGAGTASAYYLDLAAVHGDGDASNIVSPANYYGPNPSRWTEDFDLISTAYKSSGSGAGSVDQYIYGDSIGAFIQHMAPRSESSIQGGFGGGGFSLGGKLAAAGGWTLVSYYLPSTAGDSQTGGAASYARSWCSGVVLEGISGANNADGYVVIEYDDSSGSFEPEPIPPLDPSEPPAWGLAITDRTQADVDFVKTNRQNASPLKGALNYQDWNRITGNIRYLYSVLEGKGYTIPARKSKSVWTRGEIPSYSEIQTIQADLLSLYNAASKLITTPFVPSMPYTSYKKLNDIEKLLYDMWAILFLYPYVDHRNQLNEIYFGEGEYP